MVASRFFTPAGISSSPAGISPGVSPGFSPAGVPDVSSTGFSPGFSPGVSSTGFSPGFSSMGVSPVFPCTGTGVASTEKLSAPVSTAPTNCCDTLSDGAAGSVAIILYSCSGHAGC